MREVFFILFAGSLIGCSDENPVNDTSSADTGTVTYPSSFEAAKYSTKTLTVLPETEGHDLDGDGEVNNKLPVLLAMVDPFTSEDMTREGVNTTIVEMLAEDQLILLLDTLYANRVLTVDLLLANRNEDSAVLEMDPSSLGSDGTPNSRFTGKFTDETNFSVDTATAELPFPVVQGEPPVQIPLVNGVLAGEFYSLSGGIPDTGHWTAGFGVLVGSLPVQGLVDQVVEKIVPQEAPDTGADPEVTYYDSSSYLNMTRDEFMMWVTDLLNENLADLWLDDGSRALSAALAWEVELAQEWPE